MKFQMCSIYILIFSIISCSKDDEVLNVVMLKQETFELGLTENNYYPFWPDTFQYLGSNQWYDYRRGDTLVVIRRDMVTDDSADELEYRFIIKTNNWILPLNVKRISFDAYILPPRFNQLMFNKPIVNFKLQKYEPNKILACEITTPNGDYYLNNNLVDRMWIKLDD